MYKCFLAGQLEAEFNFHVCVCTPSGSYVHMVHMCTVMCTLNLSKPEFM